jgi:hypothetical protein
MKLNALSHREEHAIHAAMVAFTFAEPDVDDYRRERRAVAADRRAEQRRNRIDRGIDRASLRAWRGDPARRARGRRIPFLDALIAGR